MSASYPSVAEQLGSVPDAPGVYLWKSAEDKVLYVGKAKSLRKRMRQYVSGQDEREKIPVLMEQTTSFDYVVTNTEVESLILEANLIKQFRPPFNVDYRDDKSYPFLALTMSDPFPALKFTRERHKQGTRYFGPYTDSRAARETIEVVRRVYPVCSERCVEWRRLTSKGGEPQGKPCFDYQVGKGPGACVGAVTREDYLANVAKVAEFLEGRQSRVVDELDEQMCEASANLDYERAARYRNALEAVRSVRQRQLVVSSRPLDLDVVGFEREETIAGAHLFQVREGRVLAGNEFILDKGLDVPEPEFVEGFLLRYYTLASYVPKQVVLPAPPDDVDAVEQWLTALRGSKVTVIVPQRGEKRQLLGMASTNARHVLARYKFRARYDEERLNAALLGVADALGLPAPPLRIECYDISTIHGRHSVGSMVVFTSGRADTAGYRRFKIRLDTPESNDVAMMSEVLRRRFARGEREGSRFAKRPDLVIVDGGKPQLSAAMAVLADVGIDVPVVGLAKREEEIFVPGRQDPVILPAGSPALYLVKRVRDEAHRFAVTYHRELRSKAMTASLLDEIPGVGPGRRTALIKAFGSVRRLRAATLDEIATVPGVGPELAEDIADWLAESGEPRGAGETRDPTA